METNIHGIEVFKYRDDWAMALMEQGVIVKLTISRWRATSRLSNEELGISLSGPEHEEFMSQYIKLGYEKLLPPHILRDLTSVESRARRALKNYSFETVWGSFVPYSAFQNWKNENDDIRKEFFNLAKRIGNEYDDIVEEIRLEYTKMANNVWKRIYPSDSGDPNPSFVSSFTSRIVDKIPNREMIVSSFKYDATFLSIPLPSFIQDDINKAEDIIREGEMKAHEHQIEMRTKEIVAQEYRERKKELVDTFLNSTVSFLRKHIAELADHIYQVLQRNENDVNLGNVKRIKRMISQIQTLNFHNDKEINTILSELDMEVSKYKGDRNKVEIQNKLGELVKLAKKEYIPEDFNPIVGLVDIN